MHLAWSPHGPPNTLWWLSGSGSGSGLPHPSPSLVRGSVDVDDLLYAETLHAVRAHARHWYLQVHRKSVDGVRVPSPDLSPARDGDGDGDGDIDD